MGVCVGETYFKKHFRETENREAKAGGFEKGKLRQEGGVQHHPELNLRSFKGGKVTEKGPENGT